MKFVPQVQRGDNQPPERKVQVVSHAENGEKRRFARGLTFARRLRYSLGKCVKTKTSPKKLTKKKKKT